ncbi:MAG: TonB-dependent receptor [Acidobacteriota bacterium]|nr:TonB-dependent receptor [Acidobacteriota bacterium]
MTQSVRRRMVVALWLALCFALGFGAAPCAAQSASTGQLRGTVRDPQGAVVSGAAVTLIEQATGSKREATTGGNGDYVFTLLPPGKYRLEVRASGFKTSVTENITINITGVTTSDVSLEIGEAASEVVNVSGEAPLIQADSAAHGRVVDERNIRQLPLPTRNFQQLLALSAGAASNVFNTAEVGRGDTAINVNGQRTTSNSILINGIDVNSIGTGSFANLAVPATDTLQEFIVQTSQYDASAGRNVGGIVAAVTKSGTNEFHGNAYFFLRDQALNANNFFLKRGGIPRQANNRKQYGGTLGGPIVKNRLFFFGSYQGTRETNGTSTNNSIAPFNPAPDLTDDRSLAAIRAIALNRAPGFAPFINSAAFATSPQVRLLQARYPNGQFLIPSGNGRTTGVQVAESTFREEQFNTNGDWQINDNHRVSGKFFFANNKVKQGLFRQFGGGNPLQLPGYPVDAITNNRVTTASWTGILRPTLINEFRFGYNRIITEGRPTEPFRAADFGINSPSAARFPGLPGFTFANMFSIGPATTSESSNITEGFTFNNTVSWTVGSHSMKFGGEARPYRQRVFFNVGARGLIQYTGAFANAAGLGAFAALGIPPGSVNRAPQFLPTLPFTEFLITGVSPGLSSVTGGLTSPFLSVISPGGAKRDFRANDFTLFFQDDWKVNDRLTLNLGVRYDYFGPFYEKDGLMATFDEAVARSAVGVGPNGVSNLTGTFAGFFVPSNNRVGLPGIARDPRRGLTDPDWNNFAPRIGLAWKPLPTDRFVLRAGYGLYYDRFNARTVINSSFSFPVFPLVPFFPAVAGGGLSNPFAPIPPVQGPIDTGNASFFPGTSCTGAPGPNRGLPYCVGGRQVAVQGIFPGRNLRTPYVQQYSLGFQWEFIKDTQLEISYVGSQTRKLQRFKAVNQPFEPGGTVSPFGTLLSQVMQPSLVSFAISVQESSAVASYNSLQATLTRRLAKGLQGLVSYTWSHAIDEYSGQLTSLGTSDVSTDFGDQATFRGNRATADFDRRQRLAVSFVYDLPKFYSGDNFALKALLNDWQLSGVSIIQTGLPFTIASSTVLSDGARASYAPGGQGNGRLSGDVRRRLDRYFDTSRFIPSRGVGNFGTVGRNTLRGPAQANTDLSIVKFLVFQERYRAEFRTEFFNIFNQTNFANPGNVVGTPNFGRILETTTGPRIIQFAFKFAF